MKATLPAFKVPAPTASVLAPAVDLGIVTAPVTSKVKPELMFRVILLALFVGNVSDAQEAFTLTLTVVLLMSVTASVMAGTPFGFQLLPSPQLFEPAPPSQVFCPHALPTSSTIATTAIHRAAAFPEKLAQARQKVFRFRKLFFVTTLVVNVWVWPKAAPVQNRLAKNKVAIRMPMRRSREFFIKKRGNNWLYNMGGYAKHEPAQGGGPGQLRYFQT
ncbi:MAG: hypothetical protein ABMA02_17825 [Saprospiraceae bacterium]